MRKFLDHLSKCSRPLGTVLAIAMLLGPAVALAQTQAPTLNSGDTAWMLTSTALVLLMTIPGLSLFYAGMVRAKNVLSVMMQCFAITSLVTVLWMLYAYSLAFAPPAWNQGRSISIPLSAA